MVFSRIAGLVFWLFAWLSTSSDQMWFCHMTRVFIQNFVYVQCTPAVYNYWINLKNQTLPRGAVWRPGRQSDPSLNSDLVLCRSSRPKEQEPGQELSYKRQKPSSSSKKKKRQNMNHLTSVFINRTKVQRVKLYKIKLNYIKVLFHILFPRTRTFGSGQRFCQRKQVEHVSSRKQNEAAKKQEFQNKGVQTSWTNFFIFFLNL